MNDIKQVFGMDAGPPNIITHAEKHVYLGVYDAGNIVWTGESQCQSVITMCSLCLLILDERIIDHHFLDYYH